MSRYSIALRWFSALSLALAPLLFFILPGIIMSTDYASAEDQFRAVAQLASPPVTGFILQLAGAILFIPAVIGLVRIIDQRRRWVLLGFIGGALTLIGAVAALPAIGVELAQFFILVKGVDKDTTVALALALNNWPVFGTLLMSALSGIFLGLPLLGLALWRGKFIPLWLLAFFLMAVVVSFLPLPGQILDFAVPLLIEVPFLWIAFAMLRMKGSEWAGQINDRAALTNPV